MGRQPAYMNYIIITDSAFVAVLVLVTLPSLSPSSWCVRTRCVSFPLVFSSSKPVLGIWRGEEAKEREGERGKHSMLASAPIPCIPSYCLDGLRAKHETAHHQGGNHTYQSAERKGGGRDCRGDWKRGRRREAWESKGWKGGR
jgi:hypothetical protein